MFSINRLSLLNYPYMTGFFERAIHVPCPTHPDRITLWKTFIQKVIEENPLKRELNYSLMSQLSEGETNPIEAIT